MTALVLALAIASIYAAVVAFLPWQAVADGIGAALRGPDRAAWLLAAAAYLGAHLLRVARLALLLLDSGRSLRELASANFAAALATLVMPMRLGEVARLAEYYRAAGGRFAPAVSTFLVERFLDASALLLVGIIAATARDGSGGERQLVLGLVVVVWILFMTAYVTLPRTLHSMRVVLLTRGRGEGSLRWLRWLVVVEDIWLATRVRVQDRAAVLWLVTMLIWCAELTAFAIASARPASSAMAGDFLAALERGLGGLEAAAPGAPGYGAIVLYVLSVAGAVALAFAARGWIALCARALRARAVRYQLSQEGPR